ncbi:MAG: hypothetical protein ICV60_09570 [Pyrinomonadaceae bacterium]|nr:hypothetical protein [Pyrinomonadaceae bacterium]
MRDNGRRSGKKIAGRSVRRSVAASFIAVLCALLLLITQSFAQSESKVRMTSKTYPSSSPSPAERAYPKEIRGYKLARAKVKIRKSAGASKDGDEADADSDALIQFGEPRIVRTTPLGITLEVPVTVAAVKQGGRVDFLTFEDMVVNGMPVTIEDYMHSFELPNKEPVSLPQPVRLFISSPRAIAGAISDWSNPQATWPVTGRVYVFGHYKKFIFRAKRVVPVELSLTLANPLRNQKSDDKTTDPAIKQ